MRHILSVVCLLAVVALTGCGLGKPATITPEGMHLNLTGSVHGGQQPVAGARVFVFQANNTGYGNKSVDLIARMTGGSVLATAQGGGLDSTYGAYYVPTNAAGSFSITGDYLCAGTGPVYVLATQGNPGLGSGKSNPALAELAVVGPCASGSTLSPTLNIGLTETSTVTGVYTLAGFMTGPNSLSSNGASSSLSQTGIDNAATTALGLTNTATGLPLSTTAAGATIPVAKMNLLADILAGCINSDGTTTACSTLFANAKNGTATPTDTVTALLNIAHQPAASTAALTALYGLATASAPYQPYPTTQPTDLTLALSYPAIPVPNAQTSLSPNQPSIDASGDVILAGYAQGNFSNVASQVNGALAMLSPSGKVIASNLLFSGTTNGSQDALLSPERVAIDPTNHAWVVGSLNAADYFGNAFSAPTELYLERFDLSAASFASPTAFNNQTDTGFDIASDAAGDIYVPERHAQEVVEFNSTGSPAGQFLTGYSQAATGIAVDSARNIYTTSPSLGTVSVSQQTASSANGYGLYPNSSSSANLNGPRSLALDSAGSVWVTNAGNNSLAKFNVIIVTSPGQQQIQEPALVPVAVYSGGGLAAGGSRNVFPISMDGASSAWVANYSNNSISVFSKAGTASSPSTGYVTGCNSTGIAVDGSGNVWVTCGSTSTPLVQFIGLAVPVATPILPGQLGVRP